MRDKQPTVVGTVKSLETIQQSHSFGIHGIIALLFIPSAQVFLLTNFSTCWSQLFEKKVKKKVLKESIGRWQFVTCKINVAVIIKNSFKFDNFQMIY